MPDEAAKAATPAAPAAAAPPEPAVSPAAPPVPATAPEPEETGALTADEEATLLRLQAKAAAAAAGADAVGFRVENPHEAFTYGGVTAGCDKFYPVPRSLVAAFTQAAYEAGVTLTQES